MRLTATQRRDVMSSQQADAAAEIMADFSLEGALLQDSQGSEVNEEDMEAMEKDACPKNTAKGTEYGMKKFKQWLGRRGIQCNLATVGAADLNTTLRKYYAEVRGTDSKQTVLTPSTMTCLRAAIHRHLTSAPLNRPMNIMKDPEFTSANKMFQTRCKLYFKEGNKKPQHKPSIGEGDLVKLGAYFEQWHSNPQVLVEAVWFSLCYYFGRRGREGWSAMTKQSFRVETDDDGHEYVSMAVTEVTKNHQGGNKQTDQDYSDQHMYGPGVTMFKHLITKLNPDSERLFQHPLKSYHSDGVWYRKEPMGKNCLATMMQTISKKAGLSRVYTCHSVRASTITTLYRAGIDPQSIVAITKHKNMSSIGSYLEDISNRQKRQCSNALTTSMMEPQASTSSVDSITLGGQTGALATVVGSSHHIEDDVPFESSVENMTVLPGPTSLYPRPQAMSVSQSVVQQTRREVQVAMAEDGTITLPPVTEETMFNVTESSGATSQPGFMANSAFTNCTFNFYSK